MGAQLAEHLELLVLVLQLLLDQLWAVRTSLTLDQLLELRFARLGDQGLLQQNLVDQSIYVRAKVNINRKFLTQPQGSKGL